MQEIEEQLRNVKPMTAGILSYYVPRSDGSIMLYDLAGHHEYYSSHSSCLEAISQSTPSTFLLLTDISKEPIDSVKTELNYWSAIIGNVSHKCPQPSEVIVVGTHSDQVGQAKLDHRLRQLTLSAKEAVEKTKHHYAGFSGLNVTDYKGAAMKAFMSLLLETIEVVRKRCPAISLSCHVLYALLKEIVPTDQDGITLSHMLQLLGTIDDHGLSTDESDITSYLATLSDKGLIAFFPNADHTDHWIVVNQDALLKTVNGTIFAPASFEEHRRTLASNTGVVPISELKKHFPKHDIGMIVPFLLRCELCQPVVDVTDASKTLSDCVFFPSLVHADRPMEVIIPSDSFVWQLHTASGSEFFTTRCLHASIHRLANQFTLPSKEFIHDKELHRFSRRCKVWRNGISWKNELAISFVVEMDKSLRCITLSVSADNNKKNPQYPILHKCVLDAIKKCCEDFCPSVAKNMNEYIRCPPLPCLQNSTADVELPLLRNVISSGSSPVLVDVTGDKVVDLAEWLQVEPQLPLLIGVNKIQGLCECVTCMYFYC